jgi:hypothetical protein
MENSGFSQAFVAHTEINSERYSLTNRLAEKMTAPVEGMRSDSDASLRSVRLRHHFDVRIAVLVPRCAGRVMAARIGPRSTAPFEHWQRRTQRAGEDEWVTRRTDLRGKSPLPFPPTPSASIAGERCRSRSISIGGAAPASGRGAKYSDRFHRRCGLPLPATFGSEVQTPTNRPHCPQRHAEVAVTISTGVWASGGAPTSHPRSCSSPQPWPRNRRIGRPRPPMPNNPQFDIFPAP